MDELRDIRAVTEESQLRVKRLAPIIRDTAGSVGRAAPLIRQTRAAVARKYPNDQQTAAVQTTEVADTASHRLNIPEVQIPHINPRFGHINVLTIADEFTAAAFGLEWQQYLPTPQNWHEMINERKYDLLFVESAWEANGGTWKYHMVGPSAPRAAVYELISRCNELGIPTVFWNKEDPPHFEEFLETARLFDFVYTTDGDLLAEYKRRLQHNNVFLLPFAAQPKIHNPARIGRLKRERDVAFGGMYFTHKYPERREQLSYLLPAASRFNFDIFSRQFGGDSKYQFPEPYNNNVRGKLSYLSMVAAYHVYRVVLNVNSVVNSPTMCARRIFEATACGAAVVTPPSAAIDRYYPNELITVVSNADEAYNKMRALLRSDEYRSRQVHRAQRHTWEHHTYEHRVCSILDDLNLSYPPRDCKVSYIVSTNRPKNIEEIFRNVARQNYDSAELLIITHGFNLGEAAVEGLTTEYGIGSVKVLYASHEQTLGSNLNRLVDEASGDIIVRMDDDDWYGPNYTRDMVHAVEFSGADVVGKACSYIYLESMNSTILTYAGHESRYTDFVRGATLCGRRDVFASHRFPELSTSEDSGFLKSLLACGGSVYSADRFNFVVNRAQDVSSHTWKTDDAKLFGSGEMKFVGNGRDQIAI